MRSQGRRVSASPFAANGHSVQGVPLPRVVPSGPRLLARYRLAGPGVSAGCVHLGGGSHFEVLQRGCRWPRKPYLAPIKAPQGIRMAAGS
ncbi:hypothetical protein NDU88_011523 [Pleurodeles waltl]|uniref:Uncharacterized protein n=1 Tax=Pleurodeles waltl TaxID=8319 RepID=A0AAV7R0K9_PLEWA|nr:hypothetical protein NDU88_011523 [Pleurodeles waltl]